MTMPRRGLARLLAQAIKLGASTALLGLLTMPAYSPASTPSADPSRRHHRGATDPRYGDSPAVRRFAAEAAANHDLPQAWVRRELARARRVQAVRKLVMPAATPAAKNWTAYRDRFVEPQRIAAGLAFWQAQAGWLALAEARFGVPAEIVVGIIGVETYYGRITGNFRVIDALATLSFDFPAGRSDRSAFFRSELEEFFVMCRREQLDPQAVTGSFAGAIGWPQFMPGSVNRHAVDFDQDGRTDLLQSPADIIGSVANYLADFGWQAHHAVTFDVTPPGEPGALAVLLSADIVPSFSAAQLAVHGAWLGADGMAYDGLLALVELQNGGADPSYVAGTPNFYAITRYNRSSYYAMAVVELGRAVAAARRADVPDSASPTSVQDRGP
jgi:membrane-bound lytic murein transglycosylase B